MKSLLEKGSGLVWSSSILEIFFDNSLIILAISSIFSSEDLLDPEGLVRSLKRLVSLVPVSTSAFSFPDAIMFDSISMASSCIPVRVAELLSLRSKAKSGSKTPVNVTLAAS